MWIECSCYHVKALGLDDDPISHKKKELSQYLAMMFRDQMVILVFLG